MFFFFFFCRSILDVVSICTDLLEFQQINYKMCDVFVIESHFHYSRRGDEKVFGDEWFSLQASEWADQWMYLTDRIPSRIIAAQYKQSL